MKTKAMIALVAAAVACCLAPSVAFADHFKDYLVWEGVPCELAIGSSPIPDGDYETSLLEGRIPAGLEFSTTVDDSNIRLLLSGTPEHAGTYNFLLDWSDSRSHLLVDHYTIRIIVLAVPDTLNLHHRFGG